MSTEETARERTPQEVEAAIDGIGGLVNIYHAITGKDCPRHLALGMATSAVSTLLARVAGRAEAAGHTNEIELLTAALTRIAHYGEPGYPDNVNGISAIGIAREALGIEAYRSAGRAEARTQPESETPDYIALSRSEWWPPKLSASPDPPVTKRKWRRKMIALMIVLLFMIVFAGTSRKT